MTEAVPTSVRAPGDENLPRVRSLIVGSRMMLAANTTLQLTFLFAYLYLRANNFGGMWRPGVGTPAPGITLMILLVPVVTTLVLGAAVGVAGRGDRRALTRILGPALLLGAATIAVRMYQLYHTGYDLAAGTYVDIAVIWLAVILAEFVLGALWMVSIYNSHVRQTVVASHSHVRALFEYWLYVTVVAVVVSGLIQFVT